MTNPNETDRSATSKALTREKTQTKSVQWLGQDCGTRAQANLDDCSQSLKFGFQLRSLNLWGKRVNLLRDDRRLPFVYIIFLVFMGVGREVQGGPRFHPAFWNLIFSY